MDNPQNTNYVNIINGKCSEEVTNPPIIFPYECDDFQKHAFLCISRNENLLVTAHTGSGKTSVAEYAIAQTIRNGKNVVYTSPIKSLSNEKYNDFTKKFSDKPEISFGILTGDNKINPEGNCLIMTAEILRNALYKLKSKSPVAQSEYDIKQNFIDTIGCVVMDEVHFINDIDRGKVWEETIVLLDENVQLILLSATISFPERFAQWIGSIKKKKINLISTTHRAVPLRHYIFSGENIHQIFDSDCNYKQDGYITANNEYQKLQKLRQQKHRSDTNFNLIQDFIKYMQKHNMLQAIFFSFSKKNCEHYAQNINLTLVNQAEMKEIEITFNKHMHKFEKQYEKLEQYQIVKKLIGKGIAFHHSGLLPVLKEIIEIIFHKGLIKVLLCTETFAVGINVPAKTVIFTELEKHSNEGKRTLNTAEYKQMSGRAGRRGLDTSGNVIILPVYGFVDDQLLRTLLTGSVPHLQSRFKIDYQFYLKAIQSESTDVSSFLENSLLNLECKQMIEASQSNLLKISKEMEAYNFSKVPEQQMNKIIELYKLQLPSKDQAIFGFKITVPKNQTKRISILKAEINSDKNFSEIYNSYCSYIMVKDKYDKTKKEVEELKSYSQKTIECIQNFLKFNGFISEDNSILKNGIIAGQINECNAILLTKMISEGFFKGLNPEEIVGLLAIFIDDSSSDNKMSFGDISATPKLKEYINDLLYIIEELHYSERQTGIVDNEKYWLISFDFVDAAYRWTKGDDLNKVFEKIENAYIGNFIRNMIKLNNIVKDLIHLFTIEGDNEVIPVLEKIEPMIMREFVTVNSLYLTKQ